jgi:hypothetical protein
MSTFNKALREFTAARLSQSPDGLVRSEIATEFLAINTELGGVLLRQLAERQIDALIKAMSNEDADGDQGVLFPGFPAAVSVAPGVAKSIEFCTGDDIEVAREHKDKNIDDARVKLKRFDESRDAFYRNRIREDETVGDITARLAKKAEAS